MSDELALMRCPCCRARLRGDEWREQPCRRCGAELSALRDVYHKAAVLRALAQGALVQDGRPLQALRNARAALCLVDVQSTRRTFAAALALAGCPGQALKVLDGSDPVPSGG